MRRRDFLVGTGLALGGAGAAACGRGGQAAGTLPAPSPGSWAEIKAQFPLAPDLVHMAGFFLASHPRVVRDAIDAHRRGLDDNPIEYLEANAATYERGVRNAAAEYTGGAFDDLAMTDSTTMGLGLVYGGLRLQPGQEILSTTHDHIVTTISLAQRAERTGAPFRQVPLYDDPAAADAGAIVDRLGAALHKETKVVAITWVHSGTGVKLPIRAIADLLDRINDSRPPADRVLLCVDGVHGFGIDDVTLPELGCDFFMAGCHKWIFGPRGTGLIWGRREAWAATGPTICSMDPFWRPEPPDQLPPASIMTPGGFHSFEHRWALEPAFRMHLGIGKAKVAARIHELNRHLKEELAKLPKIKVRTPKADELSAGIVCFSVEGMEPPAVVAKLREGKVVASVTPPFYVPPYVRLAPSLLTLEEDVEHALAQVRAL